ncbi:MAG: glycosyltransferase family 39 protein, partial [Elusimicrobiota bacterium]
MKFGSPSPKDPEEDDDERLLDSEERGDSRINPFEDPDAHYEEEEGPKILDRWAVAGSLALLAALILFHAVQLGSWNRRNELPPGWDQSIQLETAVDVKKALADWDIKALFSMKPKPGMPPFPPLHHLLIQYSLDEENPAESALWINWFYMIVLCAALWGLGLRLAGPWAGLGAAVLFTCAPEVQWLYRENLLDLGLTAWVTAAYWALIDSEKFERKRSSIAFGAFFGIAMMTKWSAFSYFLPLFWMAAEASNEPRKFKNLLRAAVVALLICGPWYLIQWSVVLPRLFEASSDNAVPLSRLSGFLSYFYQMALGLETPLFLAGMVFIGLVSGDKQMRKDGAVFLTWFCVAFVFWTIVPNRQLRYLLPALPPLALMTVANGRRRFVIALCVLQFFVGLNYSYGWISHKRFNILLPFSFFRTQLPKIEDWKIVDILRSAEARRDKEMPFSNLAVLGNHKRFNGAIFNWERDRLGIDGIEIRGINKRVSEFAEFVVIKMGSLGPKSVIGQLPKVRQEILINTSWFMRGYRIVDRWSMPDESEVLLFQRRKIRRPFYTGTKARFDYWKDDAFELNKAMIHLGRYDANKGYWPKVRLTAKRLVIRGLELRDLDLIMEGLSLVPVEDPELHKDRAGLLLDSRILRMKRLTIVSASVTEKNALKMLAKRAKQVKG